MLRISFTDDNWARLLQTPAELAADVQNINAVSKSTDKNNNSAAAGTASAEEEDAKLADAFGIQCNFALLDQADALAVDAPEWLVPLGKPLELLCARHGLRVQRQDNFHQFLEEGLGASTDGLVQDLKNLGVFNYRGTVSAAEWELSRLYCCIVLEKL